MEGRHFYPRPSAIETAAKQKNTADRATPACGQKIEISSSTHCKSCGRKLAADDKAINFKLISRTVTEFLCIDCLGERLGCGRAPIEERIKYYRESGNCTLFR